MTIEEFISDFVKIKEKVPGIYGFYPYKYLAFDDAERPRLGIMVVKSIGHCYEIIKTEINQSTLIFMAVDFPAAHGIDNDFVCVYTIKDHCVQLIALPYNRDTGEFYPRVESAKALDIIRFEFLTTFFPGNTNISIN